MNLMLNKLTSAQPEVLSSEACDMFVEQHIDIRLRVVNGEWQCYQEIDGDIIRKYKIDPSRQAAITAYWQKYHPEWIPLVEDTVEDTELQGKPQQRVQIANKWEDAGKQGKIIGASVLMGGLWWTPVEWDDEEDPDWHKTSGLDRIDPDKVEPTREETAMKVLREVVKADETDGGNFETLVRALTKAREFIDRQEAADVD